MEAALQRVAEQVGAVLYSTGITRCVCNLLHSIAYCWQTGAEAAAAAVPTVPRLRPREQRERVGEPVPAGAHRTRPERRGELGGVRAARGRLPAPRRARAERRLSRVRRARLPRRRHRAAPALT